jgi:hypothetical protein
VRSFRTFADDRTNTEDDVAAVARRRWQRQAVPRGVHWHIHPGTTVEYITTDGERASIPYVKMTDASGKVTEFTVAGTTPAQLAAGDRRTMDCVDCHNRPAHRFANTVEKAVDRALALGTLPRDLPYVRREAVAALKAAAGEREVALAAIGEALQKFYRENYRPRRCARIVRASVTVQDIYSHNVFPKMKLTFGTHPTSGHTDIRVISVATTTSTSPDSGSSARIVNFVTSRSIRRLGRVRPACRQAG